MTPIDRPERQSPGQQALAADGPSALRQARRTAGLAQEQLAERSGVSVRTVRGLETGKISNPHRATLLALADGLFDDPELGDQLLRTWTTGAQQLSLAELFAAEGSFAEMLNELRAQVDTDLQMLSISRRSTVGAGRSFIEHAVQEVAAALHDGVDRRPFLNLFADGELETFRDLDSDLSKVVIDRLHNCAVGDRIQRPDFAVLAAELLFGRPLAEGQTQSYGYRVDCSQGFELMVDHPKPVRGSSRQGVRRRLPQVLLEVAFDDRPPDRIWEVRGPENDPVGPLELSEFNTVHVIRHNVEPGFVGIAWEWDA